MRAALTLVSKVEVSCPFDSGPDWATRKPWLFKKIWRALTSAPVSPSLSERVKMDEETVVGGVGVVAGGVVFGVVTDTDTDDVGVINVLILVRVFAPTEPKPVVPGVPVVTIPYFFWNACTAVVVRAP